MKDLLGLADDMSRLGMKVENMLEREKTLRLKDNSTELALEDISNRIEYCYQRVQDEIKALARGVTQ
jgi:uncharacterized protein (DUF2164 family)